MGLTMAKGRSQGKPQEAYAPKFPELPGPEENSTVIQPVTFPRQRKHLALEDHLLNMYR